MRCQRYPHRALSRLVFVSSSILYLWSVLEVNGSYVDEDTPSGRSVAIPYTIDSNRLSDGISSVNPFTGTSPAFELYDDAVEDYQSRNSREVVAVSTSSSCSFPVWAKKVWNPSGAQLTYSRIYNLTVSPDCRWQDGRYNVSADGFTPRYDATKLCWVYENACCLECKETPRFAAHMMQLVCCLGKYYWKLTEVAGSRSTRMMPMDEGLVNRNCFSFRTGQNLFRAPIDGELICYANQPFGWYWDNAGSITVHVSAYNG